MTRYSAVVEIKQLSDPDFEEIWQIEDASCSLTAFVAIHSTKLGPAIGGVRLRAYADQADAVTEVKRLAEGMTYKAAIAGLKYGGGKGVIMLPAGEFDRRALYQGFAELINHLQGRYISAIDAGTQLEDVAEMKRHSQWVGGAPESAGGSGDPSPITARGVLAGIKAAVEEALGSDSLSGVRVGVQGLGSVGSRLVELLNQAGCTVWGTDIDPRRILTLSAQTSLHSVIPEQLLAQDLDVLSPCALGSVLNEQSIPELQCRIVAGAANDQLSHREDAQRLHERHILYAPDFVINSGGLIHIAVELAGAAEAKALEQADAIGETLREIFQRSKSEHINTHEAALAEAKRRISSV